MRSRLPASDDDDLQPYSDFQRETMRKKMVAEGFLFDLPLHALSERDRSEIDGRLFLADLAAAEGQTIPQMIDGFERELATAKAFDTVEALMKWLHDDPASEPAK